MTTTRPALVGADERRDVPALLPPFDRVAITLRFDRRVRLGFVHGGVLRGALAAAVGRHELDGMIPFTPESGRVTYEANDVYRLGVTLVGAYRSAAGALAAGLDALGRKPWQGGGPPPTFRGNFSVERFEVLKTPTVSEALVRLPETSVVTLRFVSPLRLLRPIDQQVVPTRYVNRDCFPIAWFIDKVHDRLCQLAVGAHPDPSEAPSVRWPQLRDLRVDSSDLHWIDMPVRGAEGRDPRRPRGYTLGGVVGTVKVQGDLSCVLPILVAGQYLHAGESTSFGFGRYRIEEVLALDDFDRPAESALARALRPERLQEALGHLRAKAASEGEPAGGRPIDWDNLDIDEVSRFWRSPGCEAGTLHGALVPKPRGGMRALAVPPIRDRVAQRSAMQVLAPAFDTLLEECSFAYRKGFSRAGAARAISRAYADGYRWVLDADLEAFFDAVDWQRLMGKLRALLPAEPLVDLVEKWVKAPVRFSGKVIRRSRGLPQGVPLSPLLANLFLDEFDEELLGEGFRLVRYADDFVILCKDRESADKACSAARAAAQRQGLELNADKTGVHSFESGFTYLGYLFCRSTAMESHTHELLDDGDASSSSISKMSWASTLLDAEPRALSRTGPARSHGTRPEVQALGTGAAAEKARRKPCVLTDPTATVHLDQGALSIRRPGRPTESVPIGWLAYVMVCGRIQLSTAALLALADKDVPVHFCSRTGEPQATLSGAIPDWNLLMAQGRFGESEAFRLDFSREVVSAKIHNTSRLVSRLRLDERERAAAELRTLRDEAAGATSIDSLLGYEGRAAAVFFRLLAEQLDPVWKFGGRRQHPATDPVNSMLSFGYTILYHHVTTALLAHGLNPRLGLMHQGRGAHQALASDLMEELRHLIEAHVWDLVAHKRIHPDDFSVEPGARGAMLMLPRARGVFIQSLYERFETNFTPEAGSPTTYRDFVDEQVARLREVLLGGQERYVALRIHA